MNQKISEQRTTEWFNARLGLVTASRINDVMAKTKSGYSASRNNYMTEKILEILTGKVAESYTSTSMQWGIDTEPLAIKEYELRTFYHVEKAGFIHHPTIEKAGASPDGFIGENGLIEVKCPNTSTHFDTLLNDKVDRKYILQMQFQLACVGCEWCDFVSYDPRLPDYLQMYTKRFDRDEEIIKDIECEVIKFIDELNEKLEVLRSFNSV